MRALYVYENLDFERGGDPYDSLQIGNKAGKIRLQGENISTFIHLFPDDPEDLDDDEDYGNWKETYTKARKAFLNNNGLDFAAVVEYAIEEEKEIPDYWSDIDPHNAGPDVVDRWSNAGKEIFREWALAVLEYFEASFGIDATKYKKMVERI